MKLFHGTTLNKFKRMLSTGFIGNNQTIWNVSECETTYFWTEKFLEDENEFSHYYDDPEECHNAMMQAGIRRATESAEVALGTEKSNLRRVVLVLDAEDFGLDDSLEPDCSSDGMQHCMQYSGLIPVSMIREVWRDTEDLDLFAVYFIGGLQSINETQNRECSVYMGDNENLNWNVKVAAEKFYDELNMAWLEDISYNFEMVKIFDCLDTFISPEIIQVMN